MHRLRPDQQAIFKFANGSLGQQWSTLSASQKTCYQEESSSEHSGLGDTIIPNVEQRSKKEVDLLSGMKKYVPVPTEISKLTLLQSNLLYEQGVVTFILIVNKDDPTSLPATYFPGAEHDENKNSPCAVLYKMQEGSLRLEMDLLVREKMRRTSASNYLFSEALGKISRLGLEQMLFVCFKSR